MSQALIAAVAAGALAGGGVVAAFHLFSESTPQTAVDQVAVAPGSGEISAQLSQIIDEQRSISGRLEMLEARPSGGAPARAAVVDPNALLSDVEVDELRDLIETTQAIRETGVEADFGSIETVRSAMEVVEAEREAERDAERAQRNEERRAEMVAELTEQLALDGYQSEQLGRLFSERDAEFSSVRDQMREMDDRDMIRDMFTEVRDRYDGQLQGLFTADQYDQYQDMGSNRGRGGFGGFGGGGGGRGR